MATTGIKNTKMMLLRKPFIVQGIITGHNERGLSELIGLSGPRRHAKDVQSSMAEEELPPPASYWMPHPRSGIYFPKGQEWVVDDIPDNAASFDQSFWLRNSTTNGVDHCDDKPDILPVDDFKSHNPK